MIDGLYSPPVDGRAADQFSANGAEGIKHFGSLFPLEAHFQRKGSLSVCFAAPISPGEAGLLPGFDSRSGFWPLCQALSDLQ
jgi:hypothetical protein